MGSTQPPRGRLCLVSAPRCCSPPSAPPDADASLAPTNGFDAAATKAALPSFGAEVLQPPSAPPDADASLAPTNGLDSAATKVALPDFGAEVLPPPLDASRRRCLLGTDDWVRRRHPEGDDA